MDEKIPRPRTLCEFREQRLHREKVVNALKEMGRKRLQKKRAAGLLPPRRPEPEDAGEP